MDARTWFLTEHAREFALERRLWELPEPLLRRCLDGHNSLVWLFWHIARCEDVAVNLVLRDGPQILEQDGWAERLDVDARDIGTGMADEEAGDLSARVGLVHLRAYREAVGRATRDWVKTADFAALAAPVDLAGRRARERGAIRAELALPDLWDQQQGEFFLSWLAGGHHYVHLGEAQHVAQLLQELPPA